MNKTWSIAFLAFFLGMILASVGETLCKDGPYEFGWLQAVKVVIVLFGFWFAGFIYNKND